MWIKSRLTNGMKNGVENMPIKLKPHQIDAIKKMHNGCILNGGMGTGKSITSLYYYLKETNAEKDLYIITTARKRNLGEWEDECLKVFNKRQLTRVKIIDSWNNIKKYDKVHESFFIFDEDRVTGSGAWVKAFLKISKKNQWIILSATPGDSWKDYIPVFVANGFYRNKTEFEREHIIFARYCTFPKIDGYIGTKKLERLRDAILIDMPMMRITIPMHINVVCPYDMMLYKSLRKKRWDPYKQEPIDTAAALCYLERRVVNSDPSRGREVRKIVKKHHKVIIFYNFDYEIEMLRKYKYGDGVIFAEYNGHKHELTPTGDKWVYAVQYNSGNEGWNCITANTMIFFSQNYSYKIMTQAAGRIDRMNTPFKELYYYHLISGSSIDLAIKECLAQKKDFNERDYANDRE